MMGTASDGAGGGGVVSVSIASAAIMSSACWGASLRTLVNSLTEGTLVPVNREEREEERGR